MLAKDGQYKTADRAASYSIRTYCVPTPTATVNGNARAIEKFPPACELERPTRGPQCGDSTQSKLLLRNRIRERSPLCVALLDSLKLSSANADHKAR